MTELEAISVLKMVETHGALTTNAKEMAIKALEEMAKVKEMGECYIIPKNGVWEVNGIDVHKALEKQIAKKVVKPKGALNEYYHEEECPHCKTEFKVHVAGYRYTQAVGKTHYCHNCGQKLDWK